ncbi:DUF1561 family protein [Bartonella ancashensis]|nr:DUF1561 family protein [Bartonella ancashensis]
MKLTLLSSFFGLLLTVCISFAASVPEQKQKRPDSPKDQVIRVRLHTKGLYCYAPAFSDGESYVYIDDCSSSNVLFARYDVFGRVAWNVDGVWLCMTAPSSVTGIDGKSTASWDYLLLRPCVINDPNQRWIVENHAFYTADKRFRVKDYKWYAYISKNKDDYYDHTLITMDDWIKTVATPVNINLKMFLGWEFINGSSFSTYYISDSGPKSDVFDLYYNPESGHIARYFPSSGVMSCMVSQQSLKDDWNWIDWRFCKDTTSAQQDVGSWNIASLNGREGALVDYKGNLLRVTQYGPDWGNPYTVKSDYLAKDTTSSPKSSFLFSYDIERWDRYVNGNLGDTLAYCPAPGSKEDVAHAAKILVKRSLPPSFTLSEEWIKRLWQIAESTSATGQEAIAFCGICMIQTMQMLAELETRSFTTPLQEGGYFFNTAPGQSPFISFSQRFPALAQRLETAMSYVNLPFRVGEDSFTRTSRVTRATASILLSQYDWRPSTIARTNADMRTLLQSLLNSPVGTAWFVSVIRSRGSGDPVGHVQPIIMTTTGLALIPTNVRGTTLEQFSSALAPTRSVDTLMGALSAGGAQLHSLVVYQMAQLDEIPLNLYVSQNNCTGEGDNRRGTRRFPSTSSVNQCGSGRCAIQ